jgi:hypothetical protein
LSRLESLRDVMQAWAELAEYSGLPSASAAAR